MSNYEWDYEMNDLKYILQNGGRFVEASVC